MDTTISIGVVHIIEWLSAGDAKTGRELFEDLEPLGIVSKPPIAVRFHSITTRSDLSVLLDQLAADFRSDGRIPLLHFETHGNDDGIGVSEIQAMNDAVDSERATFGAFDAQVAFTLVYNLFLETMCTPGALSRRADELLRDYREEMQARQGREPSQQEFALARQVLLWGLSAHEVHFEKARREFFFIDRFPENDQRFPITIADCVDKPAV